MQCELFVITTYQLIVNLSKSLYFVQKAQYYGINNKTICQIAQQTCNQNNNQTNCLPTVLHKKLELVFKVLSD